MTHSNCVRLTVDINGNWQLYTMTLPRHSTPLGTVTINGTDTGALVRMDARGAYVQINGVAVRNLDGRKVTAALGISGRPPEMDGGRRVNVYLDGESVAIATKLGNGNVSEGIRMALKQSGDA